MPGSFHSGPSFTKASRTSWAFAVAILSSTASEPRSLRSVRTLRDYVRWDKICVRWSLSAKHTGEGLGVARDRQYEPPISRVCARLLRPKGRRTIIKSFFLAYDASIRGYFDVPGESLTADVEPSATLGFGSRSGIGVTTGKQLLLARRCARGDSERVGSNQKCPGQSLAEEC